MRDTAHVQHLPRLLALLLVCSSLPTRESIAQDETSVTVNVKTLPGKDATKLIDQAIEVEIYNPTSRLMTVDVVYLPLEATDLVSTDADATDSPWKSVRLSIKGETGAKIRGSKPRTTHYSSWPKTNWDGIQGFQMPPLPPCESTGVTSIRSRCPWARHRASTSRGILRSPLSNSREIASGQARFS